MKLRVDFLGKGNCPELPNNCADIVRRVNSLLRNLKRTDMLTQYDNIIREQLDWVSLRRHRYLKSANYWDSNGTKWMTLIPVG